MPNDNLVRRFGNWIVEVVTRVRATDTIAITVSILGFISLVGALILAYGVAEHYGDALGGKAVWFGGVLLGLGILGLLVISPSQIAAGGSEVRLRIASNTTIGLIFGFALVAMHGGDLRARVVAILWAAGLLMTGALVGFFFGVPRSGGAKSQLEQIADWITKIIVGVGLTQLKEIPPKLWELARYIATGTKGVVIEGSGPDPEVSFAMCVILYFFVGGFLAGYILMKVFIDDELSRRNA